MFPPGVSGPAQVATERTAVVGGGLEAWEASADTGLMSPLRVELAIGAAQAQGRTACATLAAVADQLPRMEPQHRMMLTQRLHTVAGELERLVASSVAMTRAPATTEHEAGGREQPHPERQAARGAEPIVHPLARVRAAHGWSYQQLARLIAQQARQMGVANMAAERQKIWRWEHKGVVPDQLSQRALAALLGVPAEVVAAHPWPAWLPVRDDPAVLRTMEVSVLRTQLRLAVRALDEAQATGVEAGPSW
ncbi:hypothetical protein [Frankia sp. CiP3]|uniref:hypothetical protein n=1 Tax=Frankia sp. CiP3 TaxID=2880971 RepID=UPI0035B3F49C